MRLIDAGSFKENILNKQMYLIQTQDGVFCYYVAVLDAVELEPEVKAIPIEWIKNIINANIYLWEQNKERMFVDQGVVNIVNYSITAQILSELIDRWEKENGQ